ncbi:uncharacterized protein [Periplaneta americana]|uniref:uncharacterized protein isoform X2 n=1 Tax=Periplaneta americana TaxID=6978 RepID=UPI0037E75C90
MSKTLRRCNTLWCCNPFGLRNHGNQIGERKVTEGMRKKLHTLVVGDTICSRCRVKVIKITNVEETEPDYDGKKSSEEEAKTSCLFRFHQKKLILAGAQQKQHLQGYEDRSSNLYEDQQQIPEVLEVESKPLLEVPLITLTHTQEDDFENRITGEVQSYGIAPQTSEFRLAETVTMQRVARNSDSMRITGDMQSSGMAPQTSEFRPQILPMLRLARKLDSIRQVTTSEPGPSTQNPSVTVVCAPELSTMKSSSQPSEISEDPLALLSDPTYEPSTVRPRRFQNASKSVSLTLGPKPLSTRNEVTVEYFGGGSETNVNATEEYEEQQQDGRNIEKVLLQLRAEKLLLEMEKLKQERLKMEAEKRNIKLRNEILSLRIQLAKPEETISSSDHPTTRVTRGSSSNLTMSVSVHREPSQNASTKHVPLQEEGLRILCVPQQSSISNIKSSQCQNSSPDVTSAKCQTYEHAAHPATGGKERTTKKSNETRRLSSERAKEDNYKASSMPVKSSDEELTRKTRIDCSKSEQVSLSTPYLKEEGEEHFTTEQALFYSAVHGERDLERDATRHSTLLVGSLDRSGLSDSSIHESDSLLEVESMCRSRDLGCGREETRRGGGFPISKSESLVSQSDTNTDTMRTEQRNQSHGSFQHMSPVIGSRGKVGEVGSFHLHDVYSKKSESKRLFESADSCALNEEGAVVKKKRVESIGKVQSSGVE